MPATVIAQTLIESVFVASSNRWDGFIQQCGVSLCTKVIEND